MSYKETKNKAIRDYAAQRNVYLWEIAEALNLQDCNFSRQLRRELSEERTKEILNLIDSIAAARA